MATTEKFAILEYYIRMASILCKEIDETSWAAHWPGEIRENIDDAHKALKDWNRINMIKENDPSEDDADFAFKSYRNWKDSLSSNVTFSPVYGCIMKQ